MGSRRRLVSIVGISLFAFLAAEGLLALAAARSGLSPWRPATYVRWDSVRYLSIATGGYFIEEVDGRVTDGNVAWFPGYPLAIRALGAFRVAAPRAGRYLSAAFALLGLLVLAGLCVGPAPPARYALVVLLAALFPGFVYHHAVFPISMTTSFSLLALAAAARGRFAWAGLAGAVAAFSYSTGVLVAVALALAALRNPAVTGRRRWLALLQGPGVAGLGYLAAFAYEACWVPWRSFSRMQRDYYGAGFHNPVDVLLWNTRHLFTAVRSPAWPTSLQALLVAVLIAGAFLLAWRERRAMTPSTGCCSRTSPCAGWRPRSSGGAWSASIAPRRCSSASSRCCATCPRSSSLRSWPSSPRSATP